MKKFLNQLKTLNTEYIEFKNKSHTLKGKAKKFQNFIKKALFKLNEPYLNNKKNIHIKNNLDYKISEKSLHNSESFRNYFSENFYKKSKDNIPFESQFILENVLFIHF